MTCLVVRQQRPFAAARPSVEPAQTGGHFTAGTNVFLPNGGTLPATLVVLAFASHVWLLDIGRSDFARRYTDNAFRFI
jgi:hypothetical protein